MHYSVRVQVSPGNVQPYDVKALGPDNPLQGVAPSELNFIFVVGIRDFQLQVCVYIFVVGSKGKCPTKVCSS